MTTGPLLAIVGATATGKSAFALELAARIEQRGLTVEIVNADAMQLYRGMDIGTAKLPMAERRGIPHHLLDVRAVTEEVSVSWYQREARRTIEEIWHRGAVPLLVGGSGLYVSSVVFDFEFPGHDDRIRERLEAEASEQGVGALHSRLRALAPEAAQLIDPHNERRVIRALEVLEMTGDASGLGHLEGQDRLWCANSIIVHCATERSVLTHRIDARVDDMWRAGLVDEVVGLIPEGLERGVTARRAIGYAQALAQFRGEMTEAEAIDETQALTRRYARRQVSWFGRYTGATRVDTSGQDTGRSLQAVAVELAQTVAP